MRPYGPAKLRTGGARRALSAIAAKINTSGEPIMVGTGVCPKCRQPLETDESYICCADATVQWRCQSCGKVSEGFAFPYGMCPHAAGPFECWSAPAFPTRRA